MFQQLAVGRGPRWCGWTRRVRLRGAGLPRQLPARPVLLRAGSRGRGPCAGDIVPRSSRGSAALRGILHRLGIINNSY